MQGTSRTTEIARFNLEANLTPRLPEGDCFRQLGAEVEEAIRIVCAGFGRRSVIAFGRYEETKRPSSRASSFSQAPLSC